MPESCQGEVATVHIRDLRGVLPDRANASRWDIQGLRAFAVIAVILDHLTHWLPGGFVGVDVFFVISGFLITGLLLREHERTDHISFVAFYRRRIKRIIPAAVLVLVVTVAVSWFVQNAAVWKTTLLDATWSLFFAGNWRFALQSTDYFQANGPISPVQHFWSLGVEEQFYFVWPWLMLLTYTALLRRNRSRSSARLLVGVVIGVISVASFVWAIHETAVVPSRAYFSSFSRAWELGAGALLAVSAPAFARLPNRLRPVLAWFGLAAMMAALFVITPKTDFPAPAAALPVFGATLVILAGTGVNQQRLLFPLTNRISNYIGNISYSLYLWHFPVIVLGIALFGDGPWQRLLFAAAMLISSIYSFHLMEDPIRRSNWGQRLTHGQTRTRFRFSKGYQTAVLSLLAILVVPLAAGVLIPPKAPQNVANVKLPPVISRTQLTKAPPQLAALQKQLASALAATNWPKLDPTMDQVIAGAEAAPDVMWCGTNRVIESRCTWGDPHATHTAIIVGSSISMTYVAALRAAIGNRGGWKLISYGMFGCAFTDSAVETAGTPKLCAGRPNEAVSAINRLRPDVVFVSGLLSVAGAKSELAKIQTNAKVVFLPGPPGDADVRSCYTKLSQPSDCISVVQSGWARHEQDLAVNLQAVFLDPTPWFCYFSSCPSFAGAIPTKMDGRHMTAEYALRIAPVVRESLQQQEIVQLGRA